MKTAFGPSSDFAYEAGQPAPRGGHLICAECGFAVSPHMQEATPRCPACSGTSFRRARMFEPQTLGIDAVPAAESEPTAVAAAHERLAGAGPHLVWQGDSGVREIGLAVGWARIGRSGNADIRLDDATVSRRHALVVRTESDELKALDDRSLNGLFVNGARVEWTPLADGDELEIGRFRIYVCT